MAGPAASAPASPASQRRSPAPPLPAIGRVVHYLTTHPDEQWGADAVSVEGIDGPCFVHAAIVTRVASAVTVNLAVLPDAGDVAKRRGITVLGEAQRVSNFPFSCWRWPPRV